MPSGVVVADTGPLYSALSVREGRRHQLAASLLASLGRAVLVPWPVYVEVDLLCRSRGYRRQATLFGRSLYAGELRLVSLTQGEHDLALELLDRYGDAGVDLPDASVMAMAEARSAGVLTWDFRHFRAVTTRRGRPLRLVVQEHELP